MRTEIASVTTRPHPVSNTFHLVMTILTGGLWLPVWIICARGHKTTTRVPAAASAVALAPAAPADPEYDSREVRIRRFRAEHAPSTAAGLSAGEQVRGKRWDGARDPEWLAEHVPASPEYRARHDA